MATAFEEIIVKVRVIQEGLKDFGDGLKFGNKEMEKFQERGSVVGRTGTRLGVAFKKMFTGLRGFRMEMLSVMFFGLGMQKFFMGLLGPALEMTGVFDILTAALGILFLPVAEVLLDWALKFLDWVLNMSPQTQKIIGYIVLFGAALGTLLFFIGSLVLGIGGFLVAFGSFIAIVIGAGAAILGFLLSPIGLLVAAMLLAVATSGVFGTIWDGIKGIFGTVGGFINNIYASILEKFPALKKKMEDLGISTESIGQAFKDLYNVYIKPYIEAALEKLGIEFFRWKMFVEIIFKQIWFKIKSTFDDVIEKIKTEAPGKFVEIVTAILDALAKIPGKVFKNIDWSYGGTRSLSPEDRAKLGLGPIPKFASGGIVTRPTLAMIGEKGPEAVVPLGGGGLGSLIFSPTINVSATSNVDIDRLVSMITNDVRTELERLTRR